VIEEFIREKGESVDLRGEREREKGIESRSERRAIDYGAPCEPSDDLSLSPYSSLSM